MNSKNNGVPTIIDVEASGFVQHLKLPHYVDFQSELELVRKLRREIEEGRWREETSDAAD